MIEYLGEQPDTGRMKDGIIIPERKFWYFIDDITHDRPSSILLDSNLPPFKQVHPVFEGRYVTDYSLDQIEGDERKGKFEVVVKYGELSQSRDSVSSSAKEPWNKGPFNVSFGSLAMVVPQERAYAEDDVQFEPSIPVQHPATREILITDTVETHGIINFSFNLRNFRYSWKREFEDTINKSDIKILGIQFPKKTLVLKSISPSRKVYVDANGNETEYWQVDVEIEDYHKEVKKELALRGYTAIFDDKVKNIQLLDGVFGDHNQADPSLNITTPRFVNKSGIVLGQWETVYDEYYEEFPDKFSKDWRTLDLPSTME